MILAGELGEPRMDRLPVLVRWHEVLTGELERGVSPRTVFTNLQRLVSFVKWIDMRQKVLSMDTLRDRYLEWCDYNVYCYRVAKDKSHASAYVNVAGPASIIGKTLGYFTQEPGRAILRCSMMVAPRRRKSALGSAASKAKLRELFAFGNALMEICLSVSSWEVLCRPPLSLRFGNGAIVKLRGSRKCRILPIGEDDFVTVYQRFINVRIEAELLIFIAQTAMNLSQCVSLRQCKLRWRTEDDELLAIRCYKRRRGGEVVFRCYREYRAHLKRYFAWLQSLGLRHDDDLLFPFVRQEEVRIQCDFSATKLIFARAGIAHFMPRVLRKARINWMLRRSRDPDLTAEQAAHTKAALLRSYEEPHHQSASIEIIRYHKVMDPTLQSPGPGICSMRVRGPELLTGVPDSAPRPDCISPEGCLFCVHHRDILSSEYCLKLASHAELKKLELTKYRPRKRGTVHPIHAVISRIEMKLEAIAQGSEIRAQWVRDAKDSVRSGVFHPSWQGHLQLFELL